MFQSAVLNGNTFCGPCSLSAISGIGTKEIAKIVRHYNHRRIRACGIWNTDLINVLNHLGIKWEKQKANCNLLAWTRYFQKRNVVYILHLKNHFVTVRNDKIVCTQFWGKVTPLEQSKYLKNKVVAFYEIKSNPSNFQIPESKREKMAKERNKERNSWRKAEKLCKKYNISLDVQELDWGGFKGWAYLADEFIAKYYGGDDPWEDQHYFDYPDELIRQIEEDVIEIIKEKSLDKVS
jgi:hypothetical protein